MLYRLKNEVAAHLGRAVAIIVNLYDPEYVIMAGYVSHACYEFVRPSVEAYMESDVCNSDSRMISVRLAKAGDRSLMTGAAIAVWQREMGFQLNLKRRL